MNLIEETLEAEERIRKYITKTPLQHSPFLSKIGNCEVHLKLENMQIPGSFKIRGAMNKILSYDNNKKEFLTASSGNHGVAVAYTLNRFGLKGSIYLPEYTSKAKMEALQAYDVNINFYGNDCVQTELFAQKVAKERGVEFISPYNDLKIIGGQATIGMEIEQQTKTIDSVLVPVGGGGLISGIAGYLKSKNEEIEIVGCQPRNSPVMYESIKAGKIIDYESQSTIADGTAGGIEPDSITFDYCQKYVNDYILVSEEEIRKALRLFYKEHKMVVEGAAVLTIASFLQKIRTFQGSKVILVISGSRINIEDFKEIIGQ